MTDPKRFIEAAVRPLGDNAELHVMAARELQTLIEESGMHPDSHNLDQAAEQLEKGGLPRWFRGALYGLAALATLLLAFSLAREFQRHRLVTFIDYFDSIATDHFPLRALRFGPETVATFGKFSKADLLLLFGDTSGTARPGQQFEALWNSEPANPAYFADHLRNFADSGPRSASLPANYLEIADRLDPGNGWFRCVAAGFAARSAVQKNPAGPSTTPSGRIPRFMVKDPARLADVVTLLEEAAKQPRFESYERELLLCRLDVLPPGDDTLGRRFTENTLSMSPRSSAWIYQPIAEAVSVKCHELAQAGDAAGFLKVAASWETFLRRSIETASMPSEEAMSYQGKFSYITNELQLSAKSLGLTEKADHYRRLVAPRSNSEEAKKLLLRGGPDARHLLYARALSNPPIPLTDEDLRSGLRANASTRERLKSAAFGGTMLLAALLMAAHRYGRGPQVRRLSASLLRLLRPGDFAHILIGGVVLPIAVFILTEPLEARPPREQDWYLNLLKMILQASVMLTLPAVIAIQRVNRRLGFLGWRARGLPEPVAIGLGLVAIVIARFTTPQVHGTVLVGTASLFLTPLAISYLLLTLGAFFGARRTAVFWHTCCRAIVPTHVFSALLLFLLVPYHHAQEKHWTSLNVLTKIEPGIPALNHYEWQVQEQVRKNLLDLLDAKP